MSLGYKVKLWKSVHVESATMDSWCCISSIRMEVACIVQADFVDTQGK